MIDKEHIEDVDVLYDEKNVYFVEVFDYKSAVDFGPDYIKNRYRFLKTGNLYILYDGNTKEYFVIHKVENNKFYVLDNNQNKVEISYVIDKYPTLKFIISNLFNIKNIYDTLMAIKDGLKISKYDLREIDSLISDIKYNNEKPGNSLVTIMFEDMSDFLKIMKINDDDINFIVDLFYYGRELYFYDNGYYYWADGDLISLFNIDNRNKLDLIIRLDKPELVDKHESVISKYLKKKFNKEINEIIYDYVNKQNQCINERAKNIILSDLGNPFISYGIIEKSFAHKYVTSVNVLLFLYDLVNDKNENLRNILSNIVKDIKIQSYEEISIYLGCEENLDYDDFNDKVEYTLDKIIDKLNVDDNIEEYLKIYNILTSKYKFKSLYKLPKDNTKRFRISHIDPEDNKIIIHLINKNNEGQYRSLTLDEFNNFLYHPELFESEKKIKLIRESKLQNIALNWMKKNFNPDKFEIQILPYPGNILYKINGKSVMLQDKINKTFYFDNFTFWSFFETILKMTHSEIVHVLTLWLEESLKLKGYEPKIILDIHLLD